MRKFRLLTLIFFALSLLFSASRCNPKHETRTTIAVEELPTNSKKRVIEKIEHDGVGYLEYYDTLGVLSLSKVSKEFFESAMPSDVYRAPCKGFRQNKRHLIFETQNYFVQLKKRKKNYEKAWWYEFLGFNDRLNAYVYTENSVAESLEFGTLCLLDSLSNKAYQIISIGDGSVDNLVLSENGMFLAYYHNEMVGIKSAFIGVLKVDTARHEKKYLTEHCSLEVDSFYIEDMRWSGDTMLVINTLDFDDNTTYYEAKLP